MAQFSEDWKVCFLYFMQFQDYCCLEFEVTIIYMLTKGILFMVL